jgi:hypothetical protein
MKVYIDQAGGTRHRASKQARAGPRQHYHLHEAEIDLGPRQSLSHAHDFRLQIADPGGWHKHGKRETATVASAS